MESGDGRIVGLGVVINESRIYKRFHLMCFIMKTEILYTRVQCRDNDRGAVFLFPCCIAAGCSPETHKDNHRQF